MKVVTLDVEAREKLGSAESRRLRRAGRIPVNLYGMGREPGNLSVEEHNFRKEFERGMRMFEFRSGGDMQICILKDLQFSALGDDILHVDMMRVDDTLPVTINVSIEFVGTPESPSGATVDYIRREIAIAAVPRSIPESIVARIGDVEVGERLTASQLELPEGVELIERADATIITHHYKHAGPAASEEEGEEGDEAAPEGDNS